MQALLVLFLYFVPATFIAADPIPPPVSPIVFPDGPLVNPPQPGPNPLPSVPKLTSDVLYIVTSDVDAIVLASPLGLVSVTDEAGPVKIHGRFIDGNGKNQTRTYKQKHVFTVEATGVGRVELLVVPAGATSPTDVQRRTVDVDSGQAPQPPPGPVPPGPIPPPVPPGPAPVPVPQTGAWVVVVVDGLTPNAALAKVTNGPTLTALKTAGKCRIYDSVADADVLTKKNYTQAVNAAGGAPVLLVLDKNGRVVLGTHMPSDDAMLATVLKGVMTP